MMLEYVWNLVIELTNSTGGQLQRTLGYLVWAITFWALSIAGSYRRWRFRYMYVTMASHMTLVLIYAALLSLKIDITGRAFNAAVSLTTGAAIAAGVHGWLISTDDV